MSEFSRRAEAESGIVAAIDPAIGFNPHRRTLPRADGAGMALEEASCCRASRVSGGLSKWIVAAPADEGSMSGIFHAAQL